MREYNFDLNKYFFHPVISIMTPYFFILSYDRLINNLFYFNFPFLAILSIIFAGIIETISGIYFSKKYSDIFIRIRELIFILIIYAVIFYLLFYKNIFLTAYILVLVVMQWGFTFLIHSNFFSKELLFEEIKGKKGVSLSIALRNSGYISKGSFLGLKNIKEIVIFFQVIIFLLLIIYFLSDIKLLLSSKIIIFLNFLITLITISIINFYLYEQNLAFKGFLLSEKEKNEKFSFLLVFIFISIALSFLLARFKLFDYDTLLYILAFLSKFFPKLKSIPHSLKEEKIEENITPQQKEEIIGKITQAIPFFKIWTIIVLSTIIIIFSTFTIILIVFLFKPFFRKFNINFNSIILLIKKLYIGLIYLLKKALNFAKNFFLFTKELLLHKEKVEKKIKNLQKHKIMKEEKKILIKRKKVLNKILKFFSILTKKAKKYGCYYYHNLTASEYINILLNSLMIKEKSQSEEFNLVALIFDKAYFSQEYITKEEFLLYKKLIKNIIKNYY